MQHKPFIPVFSVTLLLSAALLFAVQPMFSKMILPYLGGTPQVWNTAMLFFQSCLLAGYAYAHGTTKLLSVRAQAILHLALLLVFLIVLPFSIPLDWPPPVDKDPTFWQLSIMSISVGGPFFVLAGSAPMLQRWFSNTNHPDSNDPYFLYAASNVGSVGALIAYPLLLERFFTLDNQAVFWMIGYIVLIGWVGNCTAMVWPYKETKNKHKEHSEGLITWKRRALWLFLAFIPSSLMLGVTTYITTDIASTPLIWIVPLALYISTFIIAFAKHPIISRRLCHLVFGILLIGMAAVSMTGFENVTNAFVPYFLFHFVLFFFAALSCHMELAALRPKAQDLTEFFLIMSLGGALGGVFNAILAPQLFVLPIEYTAVLIMACFMRFASDPFQKQKTKAANAPNIFVFFLIAGICIFSIFQPEIQIRYLSSFFIILALGFVLKERLIFAFGFALILMFFPIGKNAIRADFDQVLYQGRNFFGVIRVVEKDHQRILMHGTTNHGTQATLEEYRLTPLSYYSHESPLRDVISLYDHKEGRQDFAILGLGIGVTACFQKDGRHYDYYEIDPEIVRVAKDPNLFTFLSDCGSDYDIILGDGRLQIDQTRPDYTYDLMLMDAFSSDNIPIHVVTSEAVQIYTRKLKKDGILIFNVANRYLDLEPVLHEIAHKTGFSSLGHYGDDGFLDGGKIPYNASHFVVLTRNQDHIEALKDMGWTPTYSRPGVKAWSDQYSNILSVLGNKTIRVRASDLMLEKIPHGQ